jgi:hypothetical protein
MALVVEPIYTAGCASDTTSRSETALDKQSTTGLKTQTRPHLILSGSHLNQRDDDFQPEPCPEDDEQPSPAEPMTSTSRRNTSTGTTNP